MSRRPAPKKKAAPKKKGAVIIGKLKVDMIQMHLRDTHPWSIEQIDRDILVARQSIRHLRDKGCKKPEGEPRRFPYGPGLLNDLFDAMLSSNPEPFQRVANYLERERKVTLEREQQAALKREQRDSRESQWTGIYPAVFRTKLREWRAEMETRTEAWMEEEGERLKKGLPARDFESIEFPRILGNDLRELCQEVRRRKSIHDAPNFRRIEKEHGMEFPIRRGRPKKGRKKSKRP